MRMRGRWTIATVAFLLLAVSLVFGSTWAKASRYDRNAAPSRHFSTSVKVARVLFQKCVNVDAPAILAVAIAFPEPVPPRRTIVAQPLEPHSATFVLVSPSLRAPPSFLS